jgi:PBP4 family serine-type D-alanyl-D-alanine carboxypeptidase
MFVLLSLWMLSSLKESALPSKIESCIQAEGLDTGFWGIQIFAPLRQKVLYEKNATRCFRPASNMKVFTTVLAFEHLGPDYVFHTSFYARGDIKDGVLHGDLVIVGHGDPSISGNYEAGSPDIGHYLDETVQKIKEAGIHSIDGRLIGYTGFFDEVTIRKTWEWDDLGEYYATPVTDLSLNDGWIEIRISTDRNSRPTVTYQPEITPDVNITVELDPKLDTDEWKVKREWGTNHFHIRGPDTPSCEKEFHYSVWHPGQQFLEVLRGKLNEEGIGVKGHSEIQRNTGESGLSFLFNYYSASLAEVAKVLMKKSQNHYADSFLKTTAHRVLGEGSFQHGEELMTLLLEKAGRVTKTPLDLTGFSMMEGSGLSAHDYIQPVYMVALLRYALNKPWSKQWLDTFSIMGVDGTLLHRGRALSDQSGRVFAKTGYIYRSRCLSGYVECRSGEPLIFSILVNNYGCKTSEINEIQDKICGILLALRPSRSVRKKLLDHPFPLHFSNQ